MIFTKTITELNEFAHDIAQDGTRYLNKLKIVLWGIAISILIFLACAMFIPWGKGRIAAISIVTLCMVIGEVIAMASVATAPIAILALASQASSISGAAEAARVQAMATRVINGLYGFIACQVVAGFCFAIVPTYKDRSAMLLLLLPIMLLFLLKGKLKLIPLIIIAGFVGVFYCGGLEATGDTLAAGWQQFISSTNSRTNTQQASSTTKPPAGTPANQNSPATAQGSGNSAGTPTTIINPRCTTACSSGAIPTPTASAKTPAGTSAETGSAPLASSAPPAVIPATAIQRGDEGLLGWEVTKCTWTQTGRGGSYDVEGTVWIIDPSNPSKVHSFSIEEPVKLEPEPGHTVTILSSGGGIQFGDGTMAHGADKERRAFTLHGYGEDNAPPQKISINIRSAVDERYPLSFDDFPTIRMANVPVNGYVLPTAPAATTASVATRAPASEPVQSHLD